MRIRQRRGREKWKRKNKKEDDEREGEEGPDEAKAERPELSQMRAPGALHNLSTAVLHSFVSPTCLISLGPLFYSILDVASLSLSNSTTVFNMIGVMSREYRENLLKETSLRSQVSIIRLRSVASTSVGKITGAVISLAIMTWRRGMNFKRIKKTHKKKTFIV